ncbi:hypothetical protein Ahy_B07g086716 [Arachis hypogaea]|uniref:Uncharacterized protein n=1 Tax=Arachis hypogaea TaxID=3818 RepID=A0A444YAE4_ARAHY|nr:hypothetical protein Ahy_B07g086716 [Arachis hypogaea]
MLNLRIPKFSMEEAVAKLVLFIGSAWSDARDFLWCVGLALNLRKLKFSVEEAEQIPLELQALVPNLTIVKFSVEVTHAFHGSFFMLALNLNNFKVPLQIIAPLTEIPVSSPPPSEQKIAVQSPTQESLPQKPVKAYPQAQDLKARIMMVANAALKNDFGTPSFSLGFSQSSDEATITQEGEPPAKMEKSQHSLVLVEELENLVEVMDIGVVAALKYAMEESPPRKKVQPSLSFLEKFKTPVKEISEELKDDTSNEWKTIFKLDHEYQLEETRMHFASLKEELYIENLNNMLAKHKEVYIDPETNKPFHIDEYKEYMLFLDKKKLASHPFVVWWAAARRRHYLAELLHHPHSCIPPRVALKLHVQRIYS